MILDEPTAGALYFLSYLQQKGRFPELAEQVKTDRGVHLLVFDHGGGTLDVSLTHVSQVAGGGYGLSVLATQGNDQIGGDGIDLALMRDMIRRCKAEFADFDDTLILPVYRELLARRERERWSDAVWRRVLRARNTWKDSAERTKIALSAAGQAKFRVPPEAVLFASRDDVRAAPREFSTTVKLSDLEGLLRSLLADCGKTITSVLELAGVAAGDIDYVLHTGRQSQLPLVRDKVRSFFGMLSPNCDIFDDGLVKVAAARGAALYGRLRHKLGASVHLLQKGRRLPHGYGVDKLVFMESTFDEIVKRGSVYPLQEKKIYDASHIPASRVIDLNFYQNEGTSNHIDANPEVSLIGQAEVNLRDIEDPSCRVTIVVDANRKLSAFVGDDEVPIRPRHKQDDEPWTG